MSGKGRGRGPLAFFLSAWRRRQRPESVIDRAYAAWLRREPAPSVWRARVAALARPPRISVVMPVHDPNPAFLRDAIASVRRQIYPHWELVIADDASADPAIAVCLKEIADDPRVEIVRRETRGGISVATNAALAHTDGDYVAFLDHDDVLAPHALAVAACAFAEDPRLELVFSDEDQLIEGKRRRPYFKPGWNPDLLLSQNLICHLAVYRRTLVTELGGMRPDMAGAQDYDLALRVVEKIGGHRIRHVPLILYHWRQSATSFSATDTERCREAARRAVTLHLQGRATVGMNPALPQWPSVHFHPPATPPSISVVGARHGVAEQAYDPALVEYVGDAGLATGEVLLFLSPRLVAQDTGWLRALVAQLGRPETGAAGALLLDRGERWLNTGYILHPRHIVQTLAPPSDTEDPGYRGQFALPRTVSAVSLDCLAVRREVFDAARGFMAEAADFRGVDLSLRLAARGLRTVWTPWARLRYMAPPRAPSTGAAWMRQRWRDVLRADPYHNPHLGLRRGQVVLRAADT